MAADGGPAQLGQPEHAVIHASMVPMYVCRLVKNFKIIKKQINILKNKKVIQLLELWTLCLKRKKKRKIANTIELLSQL